MNKTKLAKSLLIKSCNDCVNDRTDKGSNHETIHLCKRYTDGTICKKYEERPTFRTLIIRWSITSSIGFLSSIYLIMTGSPWFLIAIELLLTAFCLTVLLGTIIWGRK